MGIFRCERECSRGGRRYNTCYEVIRHEFGDDLMPFAANLH